MKSYAAPVEAGASPPFLGVLVRHALRWLTGPLVGSPQLCVTLLATLAASSPAVSAPAAVQGGLSPEPGHLHQTGESSVAPPDPVGVYQLPSGRLIGVRALEEGGFRYIDFTTGESHVMHPSGADEYRSASDWSSETPVALRYEFTRASDGDISGLTVQRNSGAERRASRVRLPSRPVDFSNGEVRLHGRLILPDSGSGPYPVVVYAHGSSRTSAVDTRVLPYFWAAHRIAAFVYDKRGTGQSEGKVTQMFSVLASDLVAAVDTLRRVPDVDGQRIGVAGFSQGGWIAPLAASKESAIRFAFIGYGLAMSVAEEDRLEAPKKLRALGFEGDAIREFKDLNAVLHEVARADFPQGGWARIAEKLEEYRGRPWLDAVQKTQTWAGQLLTLGLEKARKVVPQMFGSFIAPFYDPVPTLESLQIPMMWVIAEEDIEAPPGPTIEAISRLKRSGKPFELLVFPDTDHGMTTFRTTPDGGRVRTGYVPGYYCTMMTWLRQQSAPNRTDPRSQLPKLTAPTWPLAAPKAGRQRTVRWRRTPVRLTRY